MIIQHKENEDGLIEGVSFKNGVLETYGNMYIFGENLENLYSLLKDYYIRMESLKELEKQVCLDDYDFEEGYNTIEKEVKTSYGLLRVTLVVHYNFTGTPFTDDDNSSITHLEDVTKIEFYDADGRMMKTDITKDDVAFVLGDIINKRLF